MKNGIVKSVLKNQYHRMAYQANAYAGAWATAVFMIHPELPIFAELQKRFTMRAHFHRVRAERAIQ